MKNARLILFLLLIVPAFLRAQTTLPDSVTANPAYIPDDPVVSMLDSLADLTIFKSYYTPGKTSPGHASSEYVPYFPDTLIRQRIADMNEQSPFEYVYNDQVKQFIELYAYKKRGLTSRIIGLSQIYFPLFEEQLDKYNLPLELKYLAVIESALNPVANSRAGAKGLWQFMYGTGKVYGLKVTSYVDDRYDPYKSTIAACEHLQDLYDIYGNWSLALAAYNSGAGNVNKAIRRSGGLKNFWAIYPYLPRETRSYVPAFIAASYVLNYSEEHNIKPVEPGILFHEIDTVIVKNVLTFAQISEMLKIPVEEVSFLNPWFKQGVIPATPENPYSLRLRREYIGPFLNNEATLYTFKTAKNQERDSLKAMVENSYRPTQVYIVKSGDNLASVARKYHMTTDELKALNNLTRTTLKAKQRLLVYTPGSKTVPLPSSSSTLAEKSPEPEKSEPAASTSVTRYHTVKSGETLSLIASKYKVSVNQLMTWNKLSGSKIMVGQKLKVGTTTSSTSSASTSSTKPSSGGSQNYFYYTIKSGDNLWDLAQKYDVTVSQIKSLNKITNANRLRAGQKIKIPNGK